ncbi:MAG: hypothetical protein ACRDYC_00860 [Acidimicrobiales bacterium]
MNCSFTLVAACVAEVAAVDGVVAGVVAGVVEALELVAPDVAPAAVDEGERVPDVLLTLGAVDVPVALADGTISLLPPVGKANTPATPAIVPPRTRW